MSTKRVLNEEFCQKLVQTASLAVGRDVLVTDEQGIILANSDRTRIGEVHEASLEVMRKQEKIYHGNYEAGRLNATLPGVTMPLLVDGVTVGSIGIKGAPEKISKYAVLIQQLSQVFLDFEMRQRMLIQRDVRKQNLLRDILKFDGRQDSRNAICAAAYEMGMDLGILRLALSVELGFRDVKVTGSSEGRDLNQRILEKLAEIFRSPQDFFCVNGNGKFVVFVPFFGDYDKIRGLAERCKEIEARMPEDKVRVRVGVGGPASSIEELKTSYEDAQLVVRVQEISEGWEEEQLFIHQLLLEKLAVQLPEAVCRQVMEDNFQKIAASKKPEEIFRLIMCWCQSRFNFSQTAQRMYIHKSTLTYRFQVIQEKYGLNLYDADKTLACYLLIIRQKLL
ncbi:MAG: hypothetical protein HFG92_08495 [Dorea sp.]|nr:hypothetical protein [Dorea sp.]